MIGKAKSCIGGTALIGYVVNSNKGYELMRNNLSGVKAAELYNSMRVIQNQNLRCKNNTISMVLSPELEDGQRLSNAQWQDLSSRFLKTMGIKMDEAQYLCFIHTEKEHKHVHIILNRIKDNGRPIKDSYIGKKAQRAAHQVAMEMGLKSAMEIKRQKELTEKQRAKLFRLAFKQAHQEITSKCPADINEYHLLLKQRGFELLPSINKQGMLQGYRVKNRSTGEKLKLSQIDRKIKLSEHFFAQLRQEKTAQKEFCTEKPKIESTQKQFRI